MILPRAARVVTAGAVLIGLYTACQAAIAADVRSGNHPGFGRIVIDTNGKTRFQLEQDGDHVVVHLLGKHTLGPPPAQPRNVIAATTDGSTLDLLLRHGARIRPARMNGRIVLDVLDAAATTAARKSETPPRPRPEAASSLKSTPKPASQPATSQPDAMPPVPRQPVETQQLPPPAPTPTPPPSFASEPAADAGVPETFEQTPPGRDVMPEHEGPVGLRARRIGLPKEMAGTAFLVPFDRTTGAASFEGQDATYVVFDERRPVDMAALAGDRVFGPASVRLLPNGTLVRIPHPAALSIALTPMPRGWRIAALSATPKQQPIAVSAAAGHLDLAAEQPGSVLNLADPDTGATLLVGTQRRPGEGMASGRLSTEFILRPTEQGVVVEPLSDAVGLKQVPSGFTLSGGASGLALSPPTAMTAALMDAAHLTRRLSFSTMPPDALLRLAISQVGEAAATPPLARGPKHRAVAESFMALGLDAEAEGLLHMAAAQDPKEAASPTTHALTAIAALLAGRPDEAEGLMDPKLNGTDEIALWRGVRLAMKDEGSPAAAAAFAATAPLAFNYPAPIRDRILPLIVETMIQGGEIAAAGRILDQRKNDPQLAYARALMHQADGDTGKALTMLDALANGHDQFDRARAAVRAVELRLASGDLNKTQAADALDKLLYAWRGDARELALRERVADLRAQSGAWRVALSALRRAEIDFPEQAAPIHARLKAMFANMIRDKGMQKIPPIEFVAMVDENADLMPDADDDETVEKPLADRLLALDLPDRAKPVLEKLLHAAKSGLAKARFGASLAMLDARAGDDPGVLSVLDASRDPDMPPDLAEQRLILRANAIAHRGDPARAATMLAQTPTVPATQARAQILETASDWAGAAAAWSDYAGLTLPAGGMLDEAQTRTVLRLATATARAGDETALAGLRDKYESRISAGPLGDMFRLLTAAPVRTSADIARSQRETNLAASVPAGLKALSPPLLAR